MEVACLNLLRQEISSLIKRLIVKSILCFLKIQRLNVFKYKIHLIFFKGIEIQNSILYFKYIFEILPIPACNHVSCHVIDVSTAERQQLENINSSKSVGSDYLICHT